jgi:hypothetical protein
MSLVEQCGVSIGNGVLMGNGQNLWFWCFSLWIRDMFGFPKPSHDLVPRRSPWLRETCQEYLIISHAAKPSVSFPPQREFRTLLVCVSGRSACHEYLPRDLRAFADRGLLISSFPVHRQRNQFRSLFPKIGGAAPIVQWI